MGDEVTFSYLRIYRIKHFEICIYAYYILSTHYFYLCHGTYLPILICDGPHTLDVVVRDLDAVLLAHDDVLGDGDRTIAARVRLVKQLAQSWNINHHVLHPTHHFIPDM